MLIVKIWKYIESLLYLNNLKGFFLLGNAFFLEATHRLVYAFLNCFSHLLNLKVKNKRKNTKLLHLLSCVRLFVTPWTVACQASLSFTNSQSLLKLMSIKLVMPSNHLILCQPLLLLPSIFPNIRVFTNESTLCIRWPKYRSFSFSICPSNEYSGLISFRMDWLDLLAAQGTLKSILQQHNSKASILQWSAFLIVQLSHPYMSTGKTIALTRRTFVSKVMSLVFNMLSRLVLAFLPGSKCLLISWLQTIWSDFGAPPNKVYHCFHCFPIYLLWIDGTGCHDLSFLNVLKWSEVAQSCPTLCDPMDSSLPDSSVHGHFPGKSTAVGAISSSMGSSRSRDWTRVSRIAGRRFTVWATRETPLYVEF